MLQEQPLERASRVRLSALCLPSFLKNICMRCTSFICALVVANRCTFMCKESRILRGSLMLFVNALVQEQSRDGIIIGVT